MHLRSAVTVAVSWFCGLFWYLEPPHGGLFSPAVATAQTITTAPELKPAQVLVEQVETTQLADYITYPARIISKVKGSVYSLSDGLVTHIFTPLGTPVQAGDKLIEIRNTDPVYDYKPVTLNAPVAGIVSAVEVTEGSSVTKGLALVTVTDPKQMEIRVEVPAADLANFHKGLTGKFRLPLLGDDFQPLDVRVRGVSPMVDPLTGTATAELVFVRAGHRSNEVPLGALGKVAFAINPHDGVQVPEQAIIYRGKSTLVRTVEGGHARFVQVILGDTFRGRTEVKKGLTRKSLVIVSASSFVADGQAVDVQNLSPALPADAEAPPPAPAKTDKAAKSVTP